jgi:hypothetical protein
MGPLFPDVIARDHVAFADVQLAVEDDRVGPAGAFAAAGEFVGWVCCEAKTHRMGAEERWVPAARRTHPTKLVVTALASGALKRS